MGLMAFRRVVVGSVVVVAALVGGAGTASATIGPRVFGGAKVPITEHPWQAAIVVKGVSNAFLAQFCGGVIVDSRHVITAAHCLDLDGGVDDMGDPAPDGVVDDPADRQVVVGAGDLGANPLPATARRVDIAAWKPMPEFDLSQVGNFAHDAALVTLAGPLDFSLPGVRPAVIVGPGELTAPGTSVRVSGWGKTAALPFGSRQLQATEVLTVSDQDCGSFYPAEFDDATTLCAIAPGKDACQGDSGGPLTALDGTLLGLVSWGPLTCASPNGAPSGYTELAEPAIGAFIRNFSPDPAYNPPQLVSAPGVSGIARSGETLTCQPGAWTSVSPGAPEIEFGFRATDGAMLRAWSPATTYTLTDADAGRRVACVERARDASGASQAASPAGSPVVGPAPAVAPGPLPATIPTPVDTVAARASFASVRCRARRCTVRVRVTDGGVPVSGVKTVRITVLPARGRVRTVTARRVAAGLYEARFSRVTRGTAWFMVSTLDLAGNRSAHPAIRRARIR